MTKIRYSTQMSRIIRQAGEAMGDYRMINEGDRILTAISGGQSSMLLWEVLRYFKRVAPIEFEICPVHVLMPGLDPAVAKLKDYFEQRGSSCEVVELSSTQKEQWQGKSGFGLLPDCFSVLGCLARQRNCNKLALGHNLDDLAEVVLLNLFHRGELCVMGPKEEFSQNGLVVIRPLAYTQSRDIAALVQSQEIPAFSLADRSALDPRRVAMQQVLADFEQKNQFLKKNIVTAMANVKSEYLL